MSLSEKSGWSMKVRNSNAVLDVGLDWFCRSIAEALSGDENRQFRYGFDRLPVDADRANAASTQSTGTSSNPAPAGSRRHTVPDQKRLPVAASPQELPAVEDGLPLLLALESGADLQRIERPAPSVDSRVGRKALSTHCSCAGQPNGAV